jgi:Putative zinc-finger
VDSPDERDQTVERLLRQSLRTPSGGVTDACLDAETLAAWADGGLSGGALAAVHAHVADCARCQDLAGTLARTRSAVPPAEPVRSQRWWLAWLVPVAAAAAAVAIWFAVPANLGAPVRNRDVALMRETPQEESPAQIETQRNIPAPDRSTPAPSGNRRELQSAPARVPQAAGSLEERAPATTPSSAEKKAEQESERSDLAKDRAVAQAPAPPATSPAPAPRANAAPAAAERFRAAASVRGATDIGPDIVSPDPAISWRIVGGAVQYSSNGGSTWQVVPLDAAAELTAGAAPATTVCWLVGRGGVVLLTLDGRTWRRVPFPEMTDLSSVRAIDAGGRVATVETADGRTFVTTDAGATWMPR